MNKKTLFAATAVSALVMIQTGIATAQSVDNNFQRDTSVGVNERAKTEYTPLGVEAGAFMIQPSVGVNVGSNDNVTYTETNKKSSSYLLLTPGFEGHSGWSRHMLEFGLETYLINYSDLSSENQANWKLYADGRYDISSRINVTGSIAHDRNTESRSSPIADPNAAKPVEVDTDGASLGVTVVGNRLRFIGTAATSKQQYHDVASVLGGTISEGYRDITFYTLGGRLDYALSPNVSLFASVEGNQRRYEQSSIADSDGSTISVGASFDLNHLARGEVRVGSFSQDYKDVSLGKLTNAYYNAKVEWFPTEITTVTGSANRSYVETRSFGATTALDTSLGLSVDHELLRNLILSASYGGDKYEFSGIDRTDNRSTFSLAGRYFMSRRLSLAVTYTHDKLTSDGAQAFRSYKDNVLQVGLMVKY